MTTLTRASRLGAASVLLTLGFLALGPALLSANAADPAEESIVPRRALVMPRVGGGGRSVVVRDAWEAKRVGTGDIPSPHAPGTADGLPEWREIEAGADGMFRAPALRGGYAAIRVESSDDRAMLLDAAGHDMVFVNGEPRAGDPYSYNFVRLPVRLRKGTNVLVFAVGRGQLRVALAPLKAPLQISDTDPTLPDLIVGQATNDAWGAVVVVNGSDDPLVGARLRARVDLPGAPEVETTLGPILPWTVRKVPFRLSAPVPSAAGPLPLDLTLVSERPEKSETRARLTMNVRTPEEVRSRTFLSNIDGSVQMYAHLPARPRAEGDQDKEPPALVVSLHGAGVEAMGQGRVYAAKPGIHLVAPTNRRPFGFDWEDWGRIDALEVMEDAAANLSTDPRRTYLTGHSMGGHGTWIVGSTYPDRFAAIAPSAGWVSFWSYGGMRQPDQPEPRQAILQRASAASDTLSLVENLTSTGIYVLHGDADDNVPVGQARTMRRRLAEFHPDFAYFEQPGAGHWWGSACCDWPPLFEFLTRHRRPAPSDIRRVRFAAANPGVSSRCDWVNVEALEKAGVPGRVDIRFKPETGLFAGTTSGVARLSLNLSSLTIPADRPIAVELDGHKIEVPSRPDKGGRLHLARQDGRWSAGDPAPASWKGLHRYGPFKEAFGQRAILVYGTKGTPEETARLRDKARFDAETFRVRGNGSFDVVADRDFDPSRDLDRSVIVYGNADTHEDWDALLGSGPVRVARGEVRLGERVIKGDDLACLFLRPRPGSDRASVGVVAGTGPRGERFMLRLPYFLSGTGFPDFLVLGAEAPAEGTSAIRAAGFFGSKWDVETGEFAWKE